jgi:hypothetical protein
MPAMRFEHLVEINDPLMPLLAELTRAQLWRGLVKRAEQPALFTPALDGATIEARRQHDGATEIERSLDYGTFRVRDTVRLHPDDRTEIHTQAGPTWPASRLTIRIEEPQPGALFLRFVYESEEVEGSGELDDVTTRLRRQAYQAADLDTVQRIRQLAEDGRLE